MALRGLGGTRGRVPSEQVVAGLSGHLAGRDEPAPTISRLRWRAARRRRVEVDRLGGRWSAGSSWLARATVPLLMLASLCGPAALMVSWVSSRAGQVAVAPPTDTPDLRARRAAAEEAALGWVQAWLRASASESASLKRWWSGVELRLPAAGAQVIGARVIQATAVAPGVWSVLVAADVTPPGMSMQRRYFQVPVAVGGGERTASARVLTLPAEVSAPGTDASAQLAYVTGVPISGPAGSTVAGFLTALLTGAGDLTRWSAPSSPARSVTPPVARSVSVQTILADRDATGLVTGTPADGESVSLLVTADLLAQPTPPASQPTPPASATPAAVPPSITTGQWLLTLTARAGRWEVSSIDSTPALSQ